MAEEIKGYVDPAGTFVSAEMAQTHDGVDETAYPKATYDPGTSEITVQDWAD